MPSAVLFQRQSARRLQRDRQRGEHAHLGQHAYSGSETEDSAFLLDRRINHQVGEMGKFGGRIAGDRDQLRAVLLDRHRGLAQLPRIAAVGDSNHDVLWIDLAKAAVQSFGSVQESRLRTHRTEQARGVARDVFGLAHAGQMNAAAARLGGANHVDRGANLVEVDLAAQRPKLAQAQFHETADLDRGVERTAAPARSGSIAGSA